MRRLWRRLFVDGDTASIRRFDALIDAIAKLTRP